jgi:hypothetical protein
VSVNAAVRPTRSTRSIGWVPFALVALVVIPAIAGSLRLVELAGGDQLLAANARITASPVPVVVHILCAVAYAILGAFQFSGAPASLAWLAPGGRSGPGGLGPGSRILGAVDDTVLPPRAGRGVRLSRRAIDLCETTAWTAPERAKPRIKGQKTSQAMLKASVSAVATALTSCWISIMWPSTFLIDRRDSGFGDNRPARCVRDAT